MAHVGTLESTSPRDLDLIFRVNVRSYYNSMRAAIGHMKVNGCEVILNIASIAASAGQKDGFAYSMSKGAVVAMTYSVTKDYLGYKIRCNCISPARVHTLFVDGFSIRTTRGVNRRCTTSWPACSPSEEWRSPRNCDRWRCFFAPQKLLSSRAAIIRLTAVSSTCGDTHD
jgi:NAD(P)-dependent dehydrogenase (short-subunit alcohol dehydrogenase family)